MVLPCRSAKNIDNLCKLNKRILLECDRVKVSLLTQQYDFFEVMTVTNVKGKNRNYSKSSESMYGADIYMYMLQRQ